MNPSERFARAVAALPAPVRERLDRDSTLDWALLEDLGFGGERGDTPHDRARLPEAVETLVRRLIQDVGIAPADVAAGTVRLETVRAWVQRVAVEPEGESYRIRDTRGGEVYTNVRPEAIAGYVTLALELAAAVCEAGQSWIEAGERLQAEGGGQPTQLARCAIAMSAWLRSSPETIPGRGPTIGVADALELAWNSQSFEMRAALSALRTNAGHGACAPRENPYAPVAGYRLHAYSLSEIRWLRALAEHASADASTIEGGEAPPRAIAETVAATSSATSEEEILANMSTLEARIAAATEETGLLDLGSDPYDLVLREEVAELAETAKGLPNAIRRRMTNVYGVGPAQTLMRLQDPEAVDLSSLELDASTPGWTVPKWLEELAASLLADTGAQTRYGFRTGNMRLDPRGETEEGYTAREIETGARGRLTAASLVEQVRLGISFARDVWTGLTLLRNAGTDGGWTLQEGETAGRTFTESERTTLEAARHIGRTLDRLQHAHARRHGNRVPGTLEQALMVAETLKGIDPAIRTAAGWPESMPPPNPRNPADIGRVSHVAEELRGKIHSIANHLIVGSISSALPDSDASVERARAPGDGKATLRAISGQGDG